jgi:Mn2+/Fe2+ NRAMP family transporter
VVQGSLVPNLPINQEGWIALVATLGTTLAPWGLAFIQSYAVDKKIKVVDLPSEKVEVVIGSILPGVIGIAIAVACAATLHPAGIPVEDARDVAISLEPLAGKFATLIFGAGLLGASLLAAAVVPLATSYSIAEGIGAPASLDLDSHHFQLFYAAFIGLTVAAVSVVSLPNLSLIPLMYASQVVNAVLLPVHVVALLLLAGDTLVMGSHAWGKSALTVGWLFLGLIITSIFALAADWLLALG